MLHISVVDHANTPVLLRCLRSLEAAGTGIDWELTVVENLPGADLDAVRAAAPRARVLANPRPLGFGANHNQALRPLLDRPEVDWALVLNDDTELPPGSLAALLAFAAAHPEAGAISPVLVGEDGREQPVWMPFPTLTTEFLAVLAPTPVPRGDRRDGWLNGPCLLLRVEALRRVGLFDERFFLFYEDTDLGLRLRDAGWARLVCREVRVLHSGHATTGAAASGLRMEKQVAHSQHLYVAKHHGAAAAALLRHATRAARLLRAAKAAVEARVTRSAEAGEHAAFLRALAAYDVREAP
jgi:N-acetylglucosaminyl-diphospho-decaprenol L-rhamnosyltransferase